jgi:hypothetical protein
MNKIGTQFENSGKNLEQTTKYLLPYDITKRKINDGNSLNIAKILHTLTQG